MKKNVVIGFLGTQLDSGKKRKWRPSVAVTQHGGFPVHRLELLHDRGWSRLANQVKREIEEASPATEVLLQQVDLKDPWDFQEVYGSLFDFARGYGFDEDREDYFVHLTTGTHVAQICWFLLTESRHVPAKLVQTSPPRANETGVLGAYNVVDLDLSRYDALQQRFDLVAEEYNALLKAGIETRNPRFNSLIERIELVATNSDAPLLLLGATGTGKSELAERIYELKLQRRRVKGRLVHVNCATLKGERAMSNLFGHRRGAFGSGTSDRRGLLREADGGVLFLDEINELGLDEQAMILHAVETGRFLPLGSDHEITSRFQLIAGANRDLGQLVADGKFRPDLHARLNLWTFRLPSLTERREDIEPNVEYELNRAEKLLGTRVGFNADAYARYLDFATSPATLWPGNFRDLGASVQRLSTLAPRARITLALVEQEIEALQAQWAAAKTDPDGALLRDVLGERAGELDPFDKVQLAYVIRICRESASLSAAGRTLFSASRAAKASQNDADRLRKYLARFALRWSDLATD
ncbi:transcriptional regulatory protein RtcR [Roseibium sp. TrichSKD4]|uniref:RNA repair transcriptional activator RtcR n=1 Tax=Roseibium sp. TrichSKD4 TaxID=744980 RepID=UPI0001E56DC7|nr:RNA repair transcriptional activator RtcR [Roseibium sp. TrichSKD4]EFO33282.1 transcriptional regulatory protein RtcR [Roseibium sp. TrichSKD4]